jgi:hypothetical protein
MIKDMKTNFEETIDGEYSITAENGNMFKDREVTNDNEVKNHSYVVSMYENGKLKDSSFGLTFEEVQKELRAWIRRGYFS